MYLLTEDAVLKCAHDGRVNIATSQNWVRIESRRVLVDNDPQGKRIDGCPNAGPTIKPCQLTLAVKTGYSDWVRIDGKSAAS